MNLIRLLVSATFVTGLLTACGELDGSATLETGAAAKQDALVTALAASGPSVPIDEGSAAAFSISYICNATSGFPQNITWDFNDPYAVGPDTLPGTVVSGAIPGGPNCAPTDFAANWASSAPPTIQTPSWVYGQDSLSQVGGVFTARVDVSDPTPSLQFQNMAVTVRNVLPVVTLDGPVGSLFEGTPYTFNGAAVDPGLYDSEMKFVVWFWNDGGTDAFNCSTESGSEGICLVAEGRSQSRMHTYWDNGSFTPTLRVCDNSTAIVAKTDPTLLNSAVTPAGCKDAATNVIIANKPPAVPSLITTLPAVPTINEGDPIQFFASYTDDGRDTHNLLWLLEPGITLAGTGNTLATAPNPDPASLFPFNVLQPIHRYCNVNTGGTEVYPVQFQVTDDDGGGGSTLAKNVTVNDVNPIVTLVPNTPAIVEGSTVTYTATAARGSVIPACDDIRGSNPYLWSCGGGDSAVVSGCGTSDLTCTCRYLDEGIGTFTARFTAFDEDSSSFAEVTINVVNANPVVNGGLDFSVAEGSTANFSGTFTDAGIHDSFNYTWNFGDASGTSGSGALGTPVTAAHVYTANGSYTANLRVDDNDGGTGADTVLVTVVDVNPIISNVAVVEAPPYNEGSLYHVTITATSGAALPSADPIASYEIDWGDGSAHTTATTPTMPHVYLDNGTYNVTATVYDEDSSSTNSSLNITVLNVPPSNVTRTLVTGGVLEEGQIVEFSGHFDHPLSADTFTYQWNMGDGLPSSWPSGTLLSTDRDVPIRQYRFQSQGTFNVVLTVTDDDAGTASSTVLVVNVVDISPIVAAPPVPAVTIFEGSAATINVSAVSKYPGYDDIGANVAQPAYQFDCNNDGTFEIKGAVPSANCVFNDDTGGPFNVPVRVYDEDSYTSQIYVVQVINVPPSAVTVGAVPAVPLEGQNVTFTATFADPSSLDTFTYTIDYGDGAVGGPFPLPAGARNIPGTNPALTHQYADSGSYGVLMTVTDDDGGTSSQYYNINVTEVSPRNVVVTAPTGIEGQALTFSISALSGDLDLPDQDAIVNYQHDCAGGTAWSTPHGTTFQCTFADDQDGPFTVSVKVNDEDTSTTATYQPTILNMRPVVTVPKGPFIVDEATPHIFAGGSFADTGADEWTAFWTFTDPKDGQVKNVGTPVPLTAGAVPPIAVPGYVFADDESSGLCGGAACGPGETPYTRLCAVLHVVDDDGLPNSEGVSPSTFASDCYEIHVQNTIPYFMDPIEAIPPVVGEGSSVSIFVYANDDGQTVTEPLLYRYYWGDGTPSTVTSNDFASHIYSVAGDYTVYVQVTDDDGGTTDVGFLSPNHPDEAQWDPAGMFDVKVINIPPEIVEVLQTGPSPENSLVSVMPVLRSYNVGHLQYFYDWAGTRFGGTPPTTIPLPVGFTTAYPPVPAPDGSPVAEHLFLNVGSYRVDVLVCDEFDCVTDFATVVIFNVDPTITAFTNTSPVNENAASANAVTLSATITDPGSAGTETRTFNFDCGDGGGSHAVGPQAGLTASYNLCTYGGKSGQYTARLTVTDSHGGSASQTTLVLVNNLAPAGVTVVPTPASPGREGLPVSVAVNANDPGQDPMLVNVDFDYNGSTFNVMATGTAGSSFQYVYPTSGSKTIAARVCDNEGACAAISTVVYVVNGGPTTPVIVFAPAAPTAGTAFTTTATSTDPEGQALTYAFRFFRNGTQVGPTVGPAAANNTSQTLPAGTYDVEVTVADPAGNTRIGRATVVVLNVVPVISSFTNNSAGVNENVTTPAPVTLSVTIADAGSTVGEQFTYVFDCGDGAGNHQVGPQAGLSASYALCTYGGKSGAYMARVTITDTNGATVGQSSAVVVANVAPAIGVATAPDVSEGQPTLFNVTATDAGGDAMTAQVDFDNDGAYEIVAALPLGGPIAHGYLTDGHKTIKFRICDSDGACTTGTPLAPWVNNAAPVGLTINLPASITEGSAVTVTANATDPGFDVLTYLFRFKSDNNCAGGAAPFATVGPQASNVATTSISSSGNYYVCVTVTDTATAPLNPPTHQVQSVTASASFTATSLNVEIAASANPSTLDEGQQTTFTVTPGPTTIGPFEVSYDINGNGDFNDDGAQYRDQPCNPKAPTPVLCQATALYAQNRPANLAYRMMVSVTDIGNANTVATAIVAVTVNNVAPVLATVTNRNVTELSLLAVALSATDVGTQDTLIYSLVAGPANVLVNPATGALTWTPTWHDEGVHTLTVRVTDSDGAVDEGTFTVTVAIIDTNDNGVSDTRERELNGGNLLPDNAATSDADGDGVSDLDEVLAGTDPNHSDAPTAPVAISPNNGDMVKTIHPTLVIANATSPRARTMTYTFVVFAEDGVTELGRIENVDAGSTTTQTVFDAVDLVDDTNYAWAAFANDGLADGPQSELATFRVNGIGTAPPAPSLVLPAVGATITTLRPYFEVTSVVDADGDAVTYEFAVFANAAMTEGTEVASISGRGLPIWFIDEDLQDMATYYWVAYAFDGGLKSAASPTGTFTIELPVVNEPPSAPGVSAPASDSEVAVLSPALVVTNATDANDDLLTYVFEIADNAGFTGPSLQAVTGVAEGATTTSWTVPVALEEDMPYFWRARASDGLTFGEWVVSRFSVNAVNGSPTVPRPLSPAADALLVNAPTGLQVENAVDPEGDALTYDFELSVGDTASTPVASEAGVAEGGGTTTWVPAGVQYAPGSTYYWRARANDGNSQSAYSSWVSFTIYQAPEIPASNVVDDGCGCRSTSGSTLAALGVMGLMLALRRRRTS